ncbi:MAG: hypothetical protein AAGA46_09565 [Cyanobacteria bacterium P01_F01_bin.13]
MNALTASSSPYKYLKKLGQSAISQTWLVRDTRCKSDALRIIQKIDFHTGNLSLVQYGQTLLGHKAQTLQALFRDVASTYTIYNYFSQDRSFYTVQSLVRGKSLHRLCAQDMPVGLQIGPQLAQVLLVLQQSYSWGLGSCCLHPSDLIQRQIDNSWVWTGTGILKTIVQQVGKPSLSLTDLFPKDTSAYFAPEFLQGHFDVSTDLYTVGVAFIQTLTQLPLKDLVHGSDGYFTIRRNWYRQRPIPDVLVETLNRMVNPNQTKRYSSIVEVLSNLEKLQP